MKQLPLTHQDIVFDVGDVCDNGRERVVEVCDDSLLRNPHTQHPSDDGDDALLYCTLGLRKLSQSFLCREETCV